MAPEEICRVNPYVMAGILEMLGHQIQNLGAGVLPTDAVNVSQLTSLETSLLALLETQSADNLQQFQLLSQQITSINGMDDAAVRQLIADALATQYNNETIDGLLLSQGSALIQGLRTDVTALGDRLTLAETQLQTALAAIEQLEGSAATQELAIGALQESDQAQTALIQQLLADSQTLSFLVINGIATSSEGIALADVVRECEGPKNVNFILKANSSRRLKVYADYVVDELTTFAAHVGYAYLGILPEEAGYVFGQKVQITLPKTGTFRIYVE